MNTNNNQRPNETNQQRSNQNQQNETNNKIQHKNKTKMKTKTSTTNESSHTCNTHHHDRWKRISVSQSFYHEGTIRTYPLTYNILGYVWYTIYTVVWWRIPGEFGEIGVLRTDEHAHTDYPHSIHQIMTNSSLVT